MRKSRVLPSPCCDSPMNHLYDEAHGVEGTYMTGSERYVCKKCSKPYYKAEGEKLGLQYDIEK